MGALADKLDRAMAENTLLESKVAQLEAENKELQADAEKGKTHAFSISRMKLSDRLVSFYTGFSSYLMFTACFNFLRESASTMRSWQGSRTVPEDVPQEGKKPGSKAKLDLEEQFFLVMVHL